MRDSTHNISVVSPFPIRELPRVWLWMQPVLNSVRDDKGPTDMATFVEQQLELLEAGLSWGVYRDGELGGFIRFDPIDEVSGFAHAIFNKGTNRSDSFFGRKTTVPAITEVAQQLFDAGVQTIWMQPFEDSHALISLLLHVGARRRALIYDATTRNGESVNFLQLSLSPEDLCHHLSSPPPSQEPAPSVAL